MVDIFVDKIISNAKVRQEWNRITRELLKVYSYYELLEDVMKAGEKHNEKYIIFPKKNTEYKGVSIIELANFYGLKPIGKKVRICPFHEDTNPSLSLNEEKGLFKCWGCGAKGNIIKFKAMLNKQNGNNKE
jgi:hypothetical protein